MICNKNSHSIQITPSSQWRLLLISSPQRWVKYRTHIAGVTLSLWSLVMHHISCCTLIISLGAGCCRSRCSSYQSMCLNHGSPLDVHRGKFAHQLRHQTRLFRARRCWCRLQLIRTERGLFSLFEDKNANA